MTSLRVCYFCMSWKQQLVHQTRSLLKHQAYFCNCIYWCIITFCTRSRCSCIAFYLGLCSEARTDMYYLNVCIVAYKNQPLICFAMQELCSNRMIHVHLINYAKKSFIIENKSRKKTSVYVFSLILNYYRDTSPSTGIFNNNLRREKITETNFIASFFFFFYPILAVWLWRSTGKFGLKCRWATSCHVI